MLRIKRIYESYDQDDGYRVLVDRLWPRGVSKANAKIDYWPKEISPSNELRKYFNHEEDKFDEFKKRYRLELDSNEKSKDFIKLIKDKLEVGNVSLLYGAKNEENNQALVLKDWLIEKLT